VLTYDTKIRTGWDRQTYCLIRPGIREPVYCRSYNTGPPELLFESHSVEVMLTELLTEKLRNHNYSSQDSARAALDITSTAKMRLKALALPR